MAYTWHRLNAGLSRHPEPGTPKSRWVSGNKPHPPREVGAYGSYLPFYFLHGEGTTLWRMALPALVKSSFSVRRGPAWQAL